MWVQPLAVIADYLDVFSDREPRFGSGIESLTIVHLILQRSEE
jgi:hypothetical protein